MTYLTFTRPFFLRRLGDFGKSVVRGRQSPAHSDDVPPGSCAEREIILEMLDRNPDAFQSEMDIQDMARLYRCRF